MPLIMQNIISQKPELDTRAPSCKCSIFKYIVLAFGDCMVKIAFVFLLCFLSGYVEAETKLREWRANGGNEEVVYYLKVSSVFQLYTVSPESVTLTMVGMPEELCSSTSFLFQGQLIGIESSFENSRCIHRALSQRARDFIIDGLINNSVVEWDGVRLTTLGFSKAFLSMGKEDFIL
ncbi:MULTISPECIES: hypothetical protein [Vibrio]|uniref:hypothetical protein n=1 Tax=Vibrio TaxID=662 RepID=UPI0010566406|nr:hypothetical protein [Vibrio splendidus]